MNWEFSFTPNQANEDLRAQYRHLDLRRSALSNNLRKRSQVARIVRNVLYEQGVTLDWVRAAISYCLVRLSGSRNTHTSQVDPRRR